MNKKIRGIGLYIAVAIMAVVWFYSLFAFYNWRIDVPISFDGDTISDGGTVVLAEKAIRREGLLSTTDVWNVKDEEISWGIIDASVHFFIMRLLALFIRDVGILVNIYYILTYVLCAWFMLYSLRRLGINAFLSAALSIIYAFLPGHILRGISHLSIGSCFSLPLMVLGVVWIIGFEDHSASGDKHSFLNRKVIESIIGALLVGFSSIYMGVFAMILHSICAFLCALDKKKTKTIKAIVLLLFDFVPAFFTVGLPNIMSKGGTIASFEGTRQVSEIDYYGMKIGQLIFPILNHRIPFLAKLRYLYSYSFLENENASSSLGLLFAIGLIISVFFLMIDNRKAIEANAIAQIGKVNVIVICISVIGGIDELIGLFVPFIRCYNRMSFIIACLSCITIALLLNRWFEARNVITQIIVGALLMCMAVLDQTSPTFKYSTTMAEAYADQWTNENNYFDSIKASGAKQVVVFPSRFSDTFSKDYIKKYETIKSYVYTDDEIDFSTGYSQGSQTDMWLRRVEEFSDDEIMKIFAAEGFDGILLYKDGFEDFDYFDEVYKSFVELNCNEDDVISYNGTWFYIPISNDYYNYLSRFDRKELDKRCDKLTDDYIELGEKYEFGSAGADRFITGGMSYPESDFRWSLGNRTTIKLNTNEKRYGDLVVDMQYVYLMNNQTIEIKVNQDVVFQDTLVDKSGTISFEIPRNKIMDNAIEMEISYSEPKSPISEGISNDSRELAVAWSSIKITDSSNNSKDNSYYIDDCFFKEYLDGDAK